jgi:thymidylate kinase
LAHAAEDEDWTAVADRVGELRRELLRRTAVSAPLRTAEYWLRDVGRLWRRWRQPTGFHVVLLGADGSGKSTAGRLAAEALAPAFASVKVEHLGPRLFRRSRDAGPVPEPHAEPPRSVLRSCAQLGYWAVDYTAGYWLRIRPRLVRDQALFYDRYLLDALVDPQRYRSAAPRWAVAAVWRCVPKPDLVVLLDAPAVVLQARKAEVPFDECARQREAYRTLVAGLPNGRIIDAAAPLEQVVSSLVDAVIAALAERTARRLALPASAPPCRANAPLTEPSHG